MRLATVILLLAATTAPALEPADVVVVSNKTVPESREVAEHYLAKRKVPTENLVELDLPTGEDITRADYDAKLAGPLREALKDRKDEVKVLLTVYGVPLRVGAKVPTEAEKAEAEKLKPRIEAAKKADATPKTRRRAGEADGAVPRPAPGEQRGGGGQRADAAVVAGVRAGPVGAQPAVLAGARGAGAKAPRRCC